MLAPTHLFERDPEVAALREGLDEAKAGSGALVLIEGEAGAGKTSLMQLAVAIAAESGIRVMKARGGEFERDFPYGVIRQLFEPAVVAGGKERVLSGGAAGAAAIFDPQQQEGAGRFDLQHGLFWLLADLAAERPVALLVDDAQWADAASLRALAYLARRLDGLAAALVMATRSGEVAADEAALVEVRQEPAARRLRPAPLSAVGAAALIEAGLGRGASPEFAEACRRVTAGNPLYLVELLRAMSAQDPGDAGVDPEHLAEIGAAGLADSIRTRLGKLGEAAIEVARAVAVLEPNAELRRVALLAGLDGGAAAAAAERLIDVQLLADARPLAFVHPLVRAAVGTDISAPRLAAHHAVAARVLAQDRAEEDTVAAHLLHSEPAGDLWVAECLATAASLALGRGVPETAARYLRRALREPPPPDRRPALLYSLGVALLRANRAEGLDVLRGLRAEVDDVSRRAEIAIEMANSLSLRGGCVEAAAVVEETLSELDDPDGELGLLLRGFLLLQRIWGLERLPEDPLLEREDPVVGDSPAKRTILQQAAGLFGLGIGPIDRARPCAEAAIAAGEEVLREDCLAGLPPQAAGVALVLLDDYERGERLMEMAIETAPLRTSAGIPGGYGGRSLIYLLRGDLRGAQLDAETVLPAFRRSGLTVALDCYLAVALRAMIGRGKREEAEALLGDYADSRRPAAGTIATLFLSTVGELKQAGGLHAEARLDFLAAAERVRWLPYANAELMTWRYGLAISEAALGNEDGARALSAEGLARAREFGSPRVLGIALRGSGLFAGGEERIDLLRQSVDALGATEARLEQARSLVEFGAALRRTNRRKEARDPLRQGLDLANRCGAVPLEERARTELVATGARPRQALLSGIDSLTPSELRVARMAAAGATNRAIAQELFVTPKTIETHLRHVYQKLDVAKRAQLPVALAGD